MERRFPDGLKNHMTGYYLIPENLRNLNPDAIESLSVAFDADLPCNGDFPMQIERWRFNAGDHPVLQNIHGLQSALRLAHNDLFPNIDTIFKLFIVFTVTSVYCQCSFLALRRHKTWVWLTMTGERLCGFTMLHSHRNMAVNREKIPRRYDASGNRNLGRFFYGQLRHAQILIFLLQLHKKNICFELSFLTFILAL